MLHVVLPVPLVFGTCLRMHEHPVSMGFVVLPLSIVGVPIHMGEFPLALGLPTDPHAFVLGAIGPDLHALPMLHATNPFALVLYATLQYHHSFFLRIQIISNMLMITIRYTISSFPTASMLLSEIFTILPDNETSWLFISLCLLGIVIGWLIRKFAILEWSQFILAGSIGSITHTTLSAHYLYLLDCYPCILNRLIRYKQQSTNKIGLSRMEGCLDNKRKKLFAFLIVLQIVILSLLIAASQFSTAIGSTIIRIVFLLVATYCMQMNFAIFYSLFALLSALVLIDPIGLFLTGHGQAKSGVQNVLCIVAFILMLIASYVGYLFGIEVEAESANASSYGNYGGNQPSFIRPINQPSNNQSHPTTSYGGTNYLFQNPIQNTTSNTRNVTTQSERNNFQPFSGQGYTLS